jgi:hypothetical protein
MKLTDSQLIILASASQREDGLAVLPEKLKGGAATKVVTKLLDQGLLKEVRVKPGEPHWRVDENERPIGLKLTRSGQRSRAGRSLGDTLVAEGLARPWNGLRPGWCG